MQVEISPNVVRRLVSYFIKCSCSAAFRRGERVGGVWFEVAGRCIRFILLLRRRVR